MKVVFLSIGGFESIEAHDQYPDLLREFRNNGHEVYIVCPNEKRTGLPTIFIEDHGVKMLRVQIGNITQSGTIEKALATVMVGRQYRNAIKKFFRDIKFDLVLYTTPPITLASVVRFLKKRDNAFTYLILKDIFPQNAVDIEMLKTKGIRGLAYKYFRQQEKRLYRNSDKIGTMSPANSKYLLDNNPELKPSKVDICPNCLEPRPVEITEDIRIRMRKKYGVPLDKTVFVYGGNLGKPQDIPFIIRCMRNAQTIDSAFFWIIGNGTEFKRLENYIKSEKPANVKLSDRLPKENYDLLIASCDVGLVFLDHRFTIPNFPSRILSYMQAGLPVLSCTDSNTDIGKVITESGFGWWCESNDETKFISMIKNINARDMKERSEAARAAIYKYSAEKCYKIIIDGVNTN